MKSLSILPLIGVITVASSCAGSNLANKREISSEPEKYILNNEVALKQIKDLKATSLTDSQCFADPETKIYLSNVKQSATGNFKDLKSQINVSKLENTADTEYYFCRVTCLLANRYAAFWTTLTDSPSRHNDDNAFICQGITMEMVNIPGTSLSTLGPIVHNFSVFNLEDVLPRLTQINYKMSASAKADLDSKAFATFAQISKAYITSTMPGMIEAGKVLDLIAYQRPGYKAVLDKYVLMLKNNNGQPKTDYSANYFVMLNILQHGRHFLYDKI